VNLSSTMQGANNNIYCTSLARRQHDDTLGQLGVSKTEPLFVRKAYVVKWVEVLDSDHGGCKGNLLCMSLSPTNSKSLSAKVTLLLIFFLHCCNPRFEM
jgi:hypothetical protein